MKKFLRVLFNIFWVILVGIESAIVSGVMGVVSFITIIGIPFGKQHFKFIKLAFAPAGKKVARNFSSHPVMNILWLIFGGFEVAIVYAVLGAVLCVTIVGIPLGTQLFKIAEFYFSPFGAEIVHDGDYTSERKTRYDYMLTCRKILANPNEEIQTGVTVKDYLQPKAQEIIETREKHLKHLKKIRIICGICIVAFWALTMLLLNVVESFKYGNDDFLTWILIAVVLIIVIVVAFFTERAQGIYIDKMLEILEPITHHYTNESPVVKETRANNDIYEVLKQLSIINEPQSLKKLK